MPGSWVSRRVLPTALAARLSRFLVGRHPRRLRQRYAEEVLDVLDQHQPTARTVMNLGVSTVSAHLDPAWRGGPSASAVRAWVGRPSA
jgi:hypothetical protein